MKLTKATVRTMIELEKKYHLLSGDMVWQEQLMEIQDEILNAMSETANGDRVLVTKLKKDLPYIFT